MTVRPEANPVPEAVKLSFDVGATSHGWPWALLAFSVTLLVLLSKPTRTDSPSATANETAEPEITHVAAKAPVISRIPSYSPGFEGEDAGGIFIMPSTGSESPQPVP